MTDKQAVTLRTATADFGGIEVWKDELPTIRLLVRLRQFKCSPGYDPFAERVLHDLVARGLADCRTEEYGVFGSKRYHYTPTVKLLTAAEKAAANVETFDQLAARTGVDISPAACRKLRHKFRLSAKNPRMFPTRAQVSGWQVAEMSKPDYIENLPEVPQDEFEFSSPGLTAQYVAAFLAANHLKTEESCNSR